MARQAARARSRRKSVKPVERVSAKVAAKSAQRKRAAAASWSEQLRQAARADGRSVYALSLAAFGTRAKQAQLARFLSGAGGITLASAEQLGRALGFRLVRDQAG